MYMYSVAVYVHCVDDWNEQGDVISPRKPANASEKMFLFARDCLLSFNMRCIRNLSVGSGVF